MSDAAVLSQGVDFVEAEMNYVVDDGKPSVRYVDWPEEEHKAHIPVYEPHRVRIHNGRTAGEAFALQKQGFTLVRHETAVRNFYDEAEILRVYYPETAQLIKAQSGAARVVVFDHTVRTADESQHAER